MKKFGAKQLVWTWLSIVLILMGVVFFLIFFGDSVEDIPFVYPQF